jgi:hypothetical protein
MSSDDGTPGPDAEQADARIEVHRDGHNILIVATGTGARIRITPRQAIAIVGFLHDVHEQITGHRGPFT